MSNTARVAAALDQWHRLGRPSRSPSREVPPDSADGGVVLCPSYPTGSGSGAICVVDGDQTEWLPDVVPVADPRLADRGGVVRTTGPCLRSRCAYWSGSCQLGAAVASATETFIESAVPTCPIRHRCRWRLEHGDLACQSCDGLKRNIQSDATR